MQVNFLCSVYALDVKFAVRVRFTGEIWSVYAMQVNFFWAGLRYAGHFFLRSAYALQVKFGIRLCSTVRSRCEIRGPPTLCR